MEVKLADKGLPLKIEYIIILILVLISAALGLVVNNLVKGHKSEIAAYVKQASGLEKRLTVVSGVRETLQRALKNSIRKKMEYKISLEDERQRRIAIEGQVNKLSSEITAAKFHAANMEDENSAFRNKTAQLEKERGYLNDQVVFLKKTQEHLQHKIKRILTRAKVELGQVVVTPGELTGKIVRANKNYNFIIVDLGKNDGAKPGMSLTAYREDKQIGEIIIEKVYDELSVCKSTFEWVGNELDAGDTIKGKV